MMLWRLGRIRQRHKVQWGDARSLVNHFRNHFDPRAIRSGLTYVFAGYGNSGDHVSHLGVQRMIGMPGRVAFMSSFSKGGSNFDGVNHLVIGGGGLFQPVFEPAWRGIIQSGIPFSILGVGLAESPPHRPAFDRELLKEIADKCCYAVVRDVATSDAIKASGGQAQIAYCPSLLELTRWSELLSGSKDQLPTRDVLLHAVHPSDLRLAGESLEDVRNRVRQWADQLSYRYEEIDHNEPYSSKVLQRYHRAALCVSSRLHGCLFAHCSGVPCVPLVCDLKTEEFYKTHTDFRPQDRKLTLASSALDLSPCPPQSAQQIEDARKHLLAHSQLLRGNFAEASA